MNELLEIIRQHRKKYPAMQPQDIVKLIYQNEFGPGHFVEDPELALQRLAEEYQKVKEFERQIKLQEKNGGTGQDRQIKVTGSKMGKQTEAIGNGLCRCYLQGLNEEELEALNRIFVYSANNRQGSRDAFEQKLFYAGTLLKEMGFGFSEEEYTDYIREQKKKGYPAVSHSETYREAYRPAYRVIEEKYASFLGLFAEIEERRQKKPNLVVGIEGNAAAGKTTLAQCLKALYDCEVIHMDEFFLPGELRSQERMEEKGGNIHYERFVDEVVKGVQSREAFEYRIFSCKEMDYTGIKRISNRKMLVIEGSYSMRGDFRDVYDYKIFLKLPEEMQKQRIIERNGENMYEMFRDKWIPMENRYFEVCRIEAVCDYSYGWAEEKVDSILRE